MVAAQRRRFACLIVVLGIAHAQVPTFTTTPPAPPVTVTTTPAGGSAKVNKAAIWGPIAGVAGLAAIGGTVAGIVASQKAGVTTTINLSVTPFPPFPIQARVDDSTNSTTLEPAETNSSSSFADFARSGSLGSLPSGKSSSSDSGSGSAWLWWLGAFALFCCLLSLIASLCACCCVNKGKRKKQSRGVNKRVQPIAAEPTATENEVAPLLPGMAPPPVTDMPTTQTPAFNLAAPTYPMTSPVVETVTSTPTYAYTTTPTYAPASTYASTITYASPAVASSYTYTPTGPLLETATPTSYLTGAPTIL